MRIPFTVLLGAALPPHGHAAGAPQWTLSPAARAAGVQVDTPLRIVFDKPPVLGTEGAVRIYRVADRALVDELRPGEDVDAIGHAQQEYKRVVRYSPILVQGATATIRPHSAKLDYDTEYEVVVDAGVFASAGIGPWTFRTRAAAPTGNTLSVDDDGPADFRTVQGALDHAMRRLPRAAPVSIRIANGRYDQLLYLRGKDNLTLHGASRDGVILEATNNDGINPGTGAGRGPLTPAANGGRSVFLIEDADMVTLDHLTMVNNTVRARSKGGQAETLVFSSDRGRLVARDASFFSEQDTIQVKGYAWFHRTLIAGNVDFIWGGNRAALFEDSEIRTVGDSAHAGGGYIVQARTVAAGEPGFVFLNSRLTHGPGPLGNDVPAGKVYLARQGPAASRDNVSFINCRMDRHIAAQGWAPKKPQTPEANPGAGWGEFGSMDLAGRPLDLSQRTPGHQLTAEQVAARFGSRQQIFNTFNDGKGWNPTP
ncbi:pectinesterase family protein [Duganella sp. CF517]|uniref:pectinesterase family protein n=1 Tax=Duganella sp. CF517 TaxID=1881038 RepID=UPI0015A5A1FE|nr:pectinesterase family protein [Duganella sp. CF517]